MYSTLTKLLLAGSLCFALAPTLRAGEADDQFAVAAGHYSAKRWDLAIEEFDRFLKEFPEHAKRGKALFFYGEALVQRGRYTEAYSQFIEVLADEPNGPYAKQALFRASEAAYMSGRNDEARMRMLQFQTKYPQDKLNAHILLYQAEMHVAGSDLTEAARLYRQLIDQYADQPVADEGRLGLVDVLKKQQSSESDDEANAEAIATLLKSVAQGKNSPWAEIALLQLAAEQVERNDHAAALALYETLSTRFPESPLKAHAALGIGRAYYQLKRYPEARKTLEGLVSHRELGPDARYWLALTDKAEKNWKSAAERLTPDLVGAPSTEKPADVSAPNPDAANASASRSQMNAHDDAGHRRRDASIRFHAAESLIRAGDFERALQMLEDAEPGDDVQSLANRYLLAVALQGVKRYDDALTTLDNLLATIERNLARQSSAASPDRSELTALSSLRSNALLAKGRLLVLKQRFEEAIKPLEAYWTQTRADQDSIRQAGTDLAVCYARTNRLTQASEVLAKLRAEQLDKAVLLATTYHVAESAYGYGDYKLSAELFERLVAEGTTPETIAKGLSGLGWSQFQLGDYESATKTFSRFVAEYSKDSQAADAAFGRAQALERSGKTSDALVGYSQAIAIEPKSKLVPQILLAQARLYDRLGQDNEATGLYERLVTDFSDSPEVDAALYGWAWALRDLGKEKESLGVFKRLHKDYPHSRYWADTAYRLAEYAWRQGNKHTATELLKPILCEDAPAEVLQHSLYLQAQIAISDQRWQDAELPLKKLVESFPESNLRLPAEFWFAEAAYRRGDMPEAAKRFDELAERTTGLQDSWYAIVPTRRAQLLMLQKRWDEARTVAESVARDYPEFDQLYEADYVIGRCFAAEADFEQARAAYRRVLQSGTGSKSETAAKAQWMIGESYFHQEDYKTAIREYLRVEILYPYPQWQAAAMLQAGKCHERLGQWKEAAEIYSQLMTKYGKSEVSVEAAARLRDTLAR